MANTHQVKAITSVCLTKSFKSIADILGIITVWVKIRISISTSTKILKLVKEWTLKITILHYKLKKKNKKKMMMLTDSH